MTNEKQTLLIVDDTPENIDVLVGVLKDDYAIKAATSGRVAVKIAQDTHPDMILLDIMMPEMDGYEVCRHLKNNLITRDIPVVFVTAKIGVDDELKGLEIGAVDYLTKPISPPIVRARVKTHLALYDQNRMLDKKVTMKTAELHETRLKIIQRLGKAAEFKDNETGLHVIRMSKYSHVLALAAGFSQKDADLLMDAAPMHDIGKIGIADSILKKPGKLDNDEFETMKAHCCIGAEVIGDDTSELLQLAKEIALTHHEKWNGAGYPNGLKEEEIPVSGRICAISDVFDALTSERPYKKAWSIDDAVDLLKKEAGAHFDATLVEKFVKSLPDIVTIKEGYREQGHESPVS